MGAYNRRPLILTIHKKLGKRLGKRLGERLGERLGKRLGKRLDRSYVRTRYFQDKTQSNINKRRNQNGKKSKIA
jgi:hypothetical protein